LAAPRESSRMVGVPAADSDVVERQSEEVNVGGLPDFKRAGHLLLLFVVGSTGAAVPDRARKVFAPGLAKPWEFLAARSQRAASVFASLRSATNLPYSAFLARSSGRLSRWDGCAVMRRRTPRSSVSRPRRREMVTARPLNACAAVAPSATTNVGLSASNSRSSHHLQAWISLALGLE